MKILNVAEGVLGQADTRTLVGEMRTLEMLLILAMNF